MADLPMDGPYIHTKDPEELELLRYGGSTGISCSIHAQWEEGKPGLKMKTPKEFLEVCWNNEFDIHCCHCRKPIEITKEPPVRLIRLFASLIIKDYHIGCLEKAKIKFIAVSHAWTDSVATAYHSGVSTEKAGRLCYEVPLRTLEAIHRNVPGGYKYHLWHDYISIPQRSEAFRGPIILPRIFDIFKKADFAILHTGIHPPVEFLQEPTMESLIEHGACLQAFFTSHIFSRLWPLVELNCVKEAYIMDNSYNILSINKETREINKPRVVDDADSQTMTLVKLSAVVESVVEVAHKATDQPALSSLRWVDELPLLVREQKEQRCLGHVFDMVSELGSRWPRDKVVAASELLHIPDYSTTMPPASTPPEKTPDAQDARNACLWLLKRQLKEANDVSPLLLRPSSNHKFDKALWFSGRTKLTPDIWGLGDETHRAQKAIQFQENAVRLEAAMVGPVTVILSWRPEAAHNAASDALAMLKGSAKQTNANSTDFDGFPRPRPGSLLSDADFETSTKLITKAMRILLKRNLKTLAKINDNKAKELCDEDVAGESPISLAISALEVFSQDQGRFEAVKRIDDSDARAFFDNFLSLVALSLSTPLPDLTPFAELSGSTLCRKLCEPAERYLISVGRGDAPDGSGVSAFRADIWQEPTQEAQLFLIPGLGYQYSVQGGTGIIVQDEEVIGRVRFGAHTVGCSQTTLVSLR